MVPAAIFLALCAVTGAVFLFDLGGFASRMRQGIEQQRPFGAAHQRLPAWTFRAFGAWCVVFGIGMFIFLTATQQR